MGVRSTEEEAAMMQMLTGPRQACDTNGSKILLSCTKKCRCSQNESVSSTFVNLDGLPRASKDVGCLGVIVAPTNRDRYSRYLTCECLRLGEWRGSSWSSIWATSYSLRSPTTTTSICSVMIWSYILILL